MKTQNLTSTIALSLAIFLSVNLVGTGFTKPLLTTTLNDEEDYQPSSVFLNARTAETWITLHETILRGFPTKTTLRESLQLCKKSIKSESDSLNFSVDRISLQEKEITLETEVVLGDLKTNEMSVHTYLTMVLKKLNLSHYVYNNVILITRPGGIRHYARDVSASEAWTWLLLNETVSFSLPEDAPLSRVIGVIQEKVFTKSKKGRRLVVEFEPKNLLITGDPSPLSTPNASLQDIEFKSIPTCTLLGLILQPIQLGFRVRDDGVVVISKSSPTEDSQIFDENELIIQYQAKRHSEILRHIRDRVPKKH